MWRYAVAFLVGNCALQCLPRLPEAALASCALVALICLALVLRLRVLIAAVAGFLWAWSHASVRLGTDLPAELEGSDTRVVGRIASLVETGTGQSQFLFAVEDSIEGVPSLLQLSWYDGAQQLAPGERWELLVRLKRRSGFANPGSFDYEGYLFRQGIGATGYVRDDAGNLRLDQAAWTFPVLRARAWIAERIALAAGPTPRLGILQGLAVGDTRAMRPAEWRAFAASGTTHLMAISGLHITMMAALAAMLGGQVARWRGAQRRGLTKMHGQVIAGTLAALIYSLLAGWSVPTQRTLIMLALFCAARSQRRRLGIADALGLALFAVLAIDPFAPLAVGAWLSFGAVAVIAIALGGQLRAPGAVRGFSRVQTAITVGLLPFIALAFGSVPLLSPLANAIAVPVFTAVIVPLVLLGSAAACICLPLGQLVLALPIWLLDAAWPMLEWIAAQPLAMWHVAQPDVAVLFALLAGVVLLLLPGPLPLRLTGLLLCVPLFVHRPASPATGDFTMSVLDVGQGLAVVLRTQTRTLVYDTGPAFRSGRDAGELVVVPYLRHRGLRRVDALVVSHGDADHDGGTRALLGSLPVERLLIGPSVAAPRAFAERCERGQQWSWDGVEFQILHPSGRTGSDNESSCVVLVRGRRASALLTGDVEAEAERQLLAAGIGRVDVVVVPHHGSRTSSTPEFVRAVRPAVAIVSAGYRNRWGFPKPQVVQRWQAAGARVLNTSDSGAIRIGTDATGALSVDQHRLMARRYWRRGANEQ